MSYCLNPSCPQPKNPPQATTCHACGSPLLLRDRYQVVKLLGKGGFGATFLGLDRSLPGTPSCVIKQLRPLINDPASFQMARELFGREAETLGKIGSSHPQVPRLLDYFEDNQQFYLVQEYVAGHNLQREVKLNGPFSEEGVKQFLSEILPILQYVHSQKIIHRDIKPANLIRRERDRKLVLIDFGAVKNDVNTVAAKTNPNTALTAFSIGTAGFAPPEQMAMRPVYASDIYALGATCLYLLTGKSPKDLDCDPATGEVLWQKYINVSDRFAQVLKKMMEVAVRDRYKSAAEVLEALALEPYLDSLSQGLTAQPYQDPSTGKLPAPGILNSSHPPARANSAATASQARRLRSLAGSHAQTSGLTAERKTDAATIRTTKGASNEKLKGTKPIPVKKLEANDIIDACVKGRRNFAQENLNSLNLQKAKLSGCNFHKSQLRQVNFQGADLSNTDFGGADLSQSVLRHANLSQAYLSYTNLEGADLRHADLRFAQLKHANLRGTNLCGANLTDANVSKEQLAQAKTNWSTILPNGKRSFW